MSRAGKYPVEIKEGVTITLVGNVLEVKGPKGSLKLAMDTKNAGLVDVKIEASEVIVTPKDAEDKKSRAMWGTMTRNIKAAVIGVTTGFSKAMYMKGVGYKAAVKGDEFVMNAGYSHDVIFKIPAGITVEVTAPTEFTVHGIDKNAVGQFADKIHKVRKVDPYKAKGIFYKGEKIIRKEGKKK